jgi:hypothetical protein
MRNYVEMNKTFAYGRVIHNSSLQIIDFFYSSLIVFEFGHSPAISTAVHGRLQVGEWEPWKSAYPERPRNPLPALHLLRMPFHRETSQAENKSTEQFLNFKCKTCSCNLSSIRAYDTHHRHWSAQKTPCSADSSKTEITFTFCWGLATEILRQHSLAKLGAQYQTIQIIALYSNNSLSRSNNTSQLFGRGIQILYS